MSNPIPGRVATFDSSGHRATIETDRGLRLAGQVTDTAANLAAGDVVTVAVRPERLGVEPATTNSTDGVAGWTAIPGRINQGPYLGDQTEFRIDTDLAGELIVRRQNVAGTSGGAGLGPGDPVIVRWHEDANLVLVG